LFILFFEVRYTLSLTVLGCVNIIDAHMLQAFESTCPFLKDVTFSEDCWTLKDINLRSWNPELIMGISSDLLTPNNLEPILAKLPNKV